MWHKGSECYYIMYEKVRGIEGWGGLACTHAGDLLLVAPCLCEHLGVFCPSPVHLQDSPCSALVNSLTCPTPGHPMSLLCKDTCTPPCPLQDAQGTQQQKRMDQFPVAGQLVNELMAEVMAHVGRNKSLEHKLFQVRLNWAALAGCPTAACLQKPQSSSAA